MINLHPTISQLEYPLPPLGQDLPKIESLVGGVPKILLERGVAIFLLLYSSTVFTVCGGKVKFPLSHFGSSILLSQPCKILIQVFIVLKHCIICIFLIYSDKLLRMLNALFKLVLEYTEKYMYNFFKYRGNMFLNIEWCQIFIDL